MLQRAYAERVSSNAQNLDMLADIKQRAGYCIFLRWLRMMSEGGASRNVIRCM